MERIEVHPDEKRELLEDLKKRSESITRREKRIALDRDELRSRVRHAYPRVGMSAMRAALGLTRQAIHQTYLVTDEATDEA